MFFIEIGIDMFSWTNTRCLYNINLQRISLQFFLLFFMANAACMLADDSNNEQSSDCDTKAKTHATKKENHSRLVNITAAHQEDNDVYDDNKLKNYSKISPPDFRQSKMIACSMAMPIEDYYNDYDTNTDDTDTNDSSSRTHATSTSDRSTTTTTEPDPVSWDEYYEDKAKEAEEQKRKDDDEASSKAADEDSKRRNEEDARYALRKAIEDEKARATAKLLTDHGYEFKPSAQAAQQLQAIQQVIQNEKDAASKRTFFQSAWYNTTSIFSTDPNIAAEKAAQANIKKEQEAWQAKSLQEIEDKIKSEEIAKTKQEEAVKAAECQAKIDQENAEKIKIHKEEAAKQRAEKEKFVQAERERIRAARAVRAENKRIKDEEAAKATQIQAEPVVPTTLVDSIWQYLGWPKEPETVKIPELSKNSPLTAKSSNSTPHNNGAGNGSNGGNGNNNNNNPSNPKKDRDNDDKNTSDPNHIVSDTTINGKIYREHIYLDPKTKCQTSHFAVAYDNPNDVHFIGHVNLTPTNNKQADHWQQLSNEHQDFCNKARNNANERSLKTQIQNIADQCAIYKNITADEACKQELELRQQHENARLLQETLDRIKTEQQKQKAEDKAIKKEQKAKCKKQKQEQEQKEAKSTGSGIKDGSPVIINVDDPNKNNQNNNDPDGNATQTPGPDQNVTPTPTPSPVPTPTQSYEPDWQGSNPQKDNDSSSDSDDDDDDDRKEIKDCPPAAVNVNDPNSNPTQPARPDQTVTPTPTQPSGPTPISSSQPDSQGNNPQKSGPDKSDDDNHGYEHKKTDIQELRNELLNAQESWKEKTDLSEISQEEKVLIDSMLNSMVDAENDMIIELAQASLRSWEHAQKAKSDEEYAYHKQKAKDYYNAVQNNSPTQSLPAQTPPVKSIDLDNLLQNYKAITGDDNQHNTIATPQNINSAHADRLKKRAQALTESKKQLQNNTPLPTQIYVVSTQARGFMMANNMNYAAFDGGSVTNFQHCLTQEILGIIESSASIAQKHDCKSIIGQLALQNCNLAVSAQQLNQSSHLEEAVAVTDLAHFFDAYAQLLIDSGLQSQTVVDINLGIIDGTAQALQKWSNFATQLCSDPHATIGKIADDCKNIGTCLYNISAKAYEFTPFAYLDDLNQDMRDSLQAVQRHHDPRANADPSRMAQRTERNAQSLKDGLYGALQAAEIVVTNMMNKSLRENVADGTEIVVNNVITGKVCDCLMNLCGLVGDQVLKAANQLKHNIPSDLQGAVPQFMQTSTGEIIAVANTTGENIGAAVAAKKAADNAQQVIKNAVQTKELIKKVDELTKPDPKEVEAFQKELEEVVKATEVLNPEKLKAIEGVDQIKKFKDYTNNFTELDKLTPDEVLYLNLCEWLHPKSLEINAQLKARGGIKIIDPVTKTETIIEKYDLFHSLLGEMSPGAVANRVSGGHLFIPELKAAIFDIGEIKPFGNGFFDMGIKYAGKASNKYKPNSYFPAGRSVEKAVEMIEDAILNFKEIKIADEIKNPLLQGFIITNQQDQKFMILINNNTAQFYPYKPKI